MGRAVLYYSLPFLIIAAIISVLVSIEQQKFINSIVTGDPGDLTGSFSAMAGMYKYSFLTMLVYVIALSVLRCTILGYIKLYNTKGKDQFTSEEVWAEVKKYALPILGISVLISMLITVGFILCIIPGIILGVSLCLIYAAYIFEDRGFGDAFNRSFKLTRQNWWVTFGLIIITYIMVYLMMLLLSIPAMLLGMKSLFTTFKNIQEAGQVNFSTSFYILNSITSLITYILFSIPFIVMAFQYFNLVEIKERPSLQDKIEQIG